MIRHAQSLTNADKNLWIEKDYSVPLTEHGREQSRNLGKQLFDKFIDGHDVHNYVFSSPYRRAQETSQYIIEGILKEYDKSIEVHGPTIIPDLMEREILEHPLIYAELKHIDALPGNDKFFYRSAHIESACNAASRMQRALYDIRSWSRQPRHADKNMNIFVVSHSLAIEAWEYLEDINNQNDRECLSYEAKTFPLDMPNFGEKRRLKNTEYRLFQYES